MISKSQAQRQISDLDQKIAKKEKALADYQTKYERGQKDYDRLSDLHENKTKDPKSLRSQERSLDTLRHKIESRQRSIYLLQSQKEDLQKELHLADIYETHAKPYLDAEQRFSQTGEALAVALGELHERVVAFNQMVQHFLSHSNAPLQLLYNLVVDKTLEGISLEKFVREGKIEESNDISEFMTNFGTTCKEIADILPLLDETIVDELQDSCRILQEWVGFSKRGNYEQLVRKGITFTPTVRQRVQPSQTHQSVTTTRMPLAPPVDNDHEERLQEIARYRRMMETRTVNANKVVSKDS